MAEQNSIIDIDEMLNWTGENEWYSVYTIQLGELIESGVFDWKRAELDWSEAAYDEEQYTRVCAYFIERFRYREISIVPFQEWARMLRRKLVYELMPKYRPLYERLKDDINPLSIGDEYYKNRVIDSEYPETLLSENADYITTGRDEEHERIQEGPIAETAMAFAARFKSVDELLLDGLESMFISMYSANMNATW